MKKPILVILAAGMGSRYGGLKQIDPIDKQGDIIMDFSVYDAKLAGFERVVFVIKKAIEKDFKERIGSKIEKYMKVEYVFQELDMLPEGVSLPDNREKPWGTSHAIWCTKDVIDAPFAVINADDYYGKEAFKTMYDYLLTLENDSYKYNMIGYVLKNTLTDHGHVARGVCLVSKDNYLEEIVERTKIVKEGNIIKFTEDDKNWQIIEGKRVVSMNFWGFTPTIIDEIEKRFNEFFEITVPSNPLKSEMLIPKVVDDLIKEEVASVKVFSSNDKWYGVTYKEDKVIVTKSIEKLKEDGVYPEYLWE